MKRLMNWKKYKLLLLAVGLPVAGWAQIDTANHDEMGHFQPSNVQEVVTFDPFSNQYIIERKVGNMVLSTEYISAEEYRKRRMNGSALDYWREKESGQTKGNETNSLIPAINVGGDVFKGIFGSNKIEIRPQGTAELILGVRVNKTDNPNIPLQQRTVTTFNFDQNIQLNVLGKIGDKIQLNANFNTKALFNFENQMNLKYEGDEDDILQLLEFGNVSLPLTGTLIQGSQALFGVKNKLKFGKFEITTIFSQQQGQKQNITVEGGAQVTKFEVIASNYELNRHYFISDYFKNQYDQANSTLPFVTSPAYITRIEVWVTNRINATVNVRNIVGILPLGEDLPNNNNIFPQNSANQYNPSTLDPSIRDITSQTLFGQLQNGLEIEKLANARLLDPNEYTFDPYLGYISLNQALNADEVLAVAFQYTVGGQTYQVGEFGTDIAAPNAIVVKLLKSSNLDVSKPNWDWMMKNIYSIGGYNIGQEDFTLNLLYQDTETGIKVNYFPNATGVSGTPLLQLFRLDRLNPQNDQIPDGFFDFVEGRTIRAQNGRIIFPVREPFGSNYLRQVFTEANVSNPNVDIEAMVQRYAYDSIYNTIQQLAELNTEKNRFYLGGSYKGASGSEISLNAFNVPQGSVTVTAGGKTLLENVDYTVDYAAGKVKIINDGILNSGLPINISLENNATFNIQQKRLFGTHIDYKFSKTFMIGGTIMNLNERPLTQKIDIGNEPTDNWIWGLDVNYSTESNFITRLVDKIPGIDTKAPSLVTINGEFAHLIPGFNSVIDKNGEGGVSYIDDFEGAETPIDIRNPFLWKLGTVPQHNPEFPNGDLFDDLRYGFNRAKLNWYIQDPLFYRNNTLTPPAIKNNPWVMSNNYLRDIDIREVFPGYQPPINMGVIPTQQVLDINFYPDERGPYNFDATAIDASNPNDRRIHLLNPQANFGSMMRRMETTDWDGANISYIEFWMMDPFNSDLDSLKAWDDGSGTHNINLDPGGGGDFIIQLGNMGEDLLRDGRLNYENGLPTPTDSTRPTIKTAWGRVPLLQPINQNFDNDPETRVLQDVGYDGLSDTAEANFFSSYLTAAFGLLGNSPAYDSLALDPAWDNYRHYTGDAYGDGSILKNAYPIVRYRGFLGPDQNSPAGNINASYQQVPNTEDVNTNFTLDQPEGYYQYKISLRPQDLQVIGQNYITDIKDATSYKDYTVNQNGTQGKKQVRWIQFRVPVRNEDKEQFGTINGFRSIRFMRMLLKGFPDDIYVRLATLQLVRADWRIYSQSLWDPDAFATQGEASFNVTTLNVEENTKKAPFPYALPPGITREIDPANPQLTQLNEQALILNVNGLQDGEGKGVYKNTEYDFRAYKYLKMFSHVESVAGQLPIDSNDLTVFVRLGMDGTENYYEVEVPLKLSDINIQPADPEKPNDDQSYRRNVWPLANELKIELEKLTELKLLRNAQNAPMNLVFSQVDAETDYRLSIVGNPNLANVRTIMIGVRNPEEKHNPWQDGSNGSPKDDGLSKYAQVWVNELRVTDYFESGGWAAKVRTQVNLADFGQVSLAVSHTTFGFGNIDQKPLQRSRNNTTTVDLTTNFEFGKFFGPKAGVTIPIFFGYSTSIANPQFNPLDPDIYFTRALDNLPTDQARDSLRQLTQTVTTRKSFNITNMKKNRVNAQKKMKIWDIENWDLSYSYTENTFRDTKTEYNNTYEHHGSIGYTFAPTPKYWEPFKKSKGLKSKWAKWIKDFNFTWSPKRLSARATIHRDWNEFLLRNTTQYDLLINPTYKKNFTWVRTYEFQYSPFKSLNLTFNATNNSRIDEPEMNLDSTVAPRVRFFGRNTSYTHNFDVNYQVPFSKLPLTDWLTASVGYSGSYKWTAGNMERNINTGEFTMGRWGNTAQNNNTFKVNVQANMSTLYNKIPWIKDLGKPKKEKEKEKSKVNTNGKGNTNGTQDPNQNKPEEDSTKTKRVKIVTWEKSGVKFRKDKKKLIKHDLKTEDVTIKVIAPDGHEVKGELQVVDKKKARFISKEDVDSAKVTITGRIEKKRFRWMIIPETLAKLVTGVKNISVSYTESNGTILPGYRPGTSLFGIDFYQSSVGPDFVFGRQYNDVDLLNKIVKDSWMVRDSTMNVLFMRTHNSNLTANATYEPFKGFRVTLTANRTFSENYQANYRYIPSESDFRLQNPLSMGNFTMSYMTIMTAFGSEGANFTSRLFQKMLDYRSVISARLAQANTVAGVYNPNAQYQVGYGKTQQDVLLYSFLAAYSGTDPSQQSMNMFPDIPIPNWRVQFDGLKEIPWIKKALKNIVLTHAYQSTYGLAGFQSNYVYNDLSSDYWKQNPFAHTEKDDNGNFISRYFLNSVSLVESFNPLIKVDMTFNNSLTANVEIKSSRNIALNFPNSQITENNTFEVIVGAGYTIKDVKLPFRLMGKQIKSNLTIRFDFGLRDNSTVIRKIKEEIEQVTAGQRAITIKGFAEYAVNQNLSVRIFVDQIINNPFVANQFPTANTNAGLSLRFTLTQ